jgi:tetratricopeptide (TPR) repeat protein
MVLLQLLLLLVAAGQTSSPAQPITPGKVIEHIPCPSDPAQTYTLYLPSGYVTNRRWPLLFVFDPGARASRATEQFRAAAERYGWVIAASENSRNGPWTVNQRAIGAMWPALLAGYAIDPARIYTAGHSGGASMAWVVARETGQVAGVIASGQPGPGQGSARPITFAWFGTAGYDDFNFLEAKGIDSRMEGLGPHRLEHFEGGHQWPPAEFADAALGWLEILAMKDGKRTRDTSLAASMLADDMKRARALEERGAWPDARRGYGAIVETYASLVDVSEARARLAAIDADKRLKDMRRSEERSDDRERGRAAAIDQMLARLAADEPTSVAVLRGMLNFDSVLKASRGDSYEGASARRTLELLFVQSSSARRELEARRDYARAATALDLALGIHPDRAALWIELAADRALSGQKGPAITALQQAIEKGYGDKAALQRDERFEKLRGTPAFDTLVK